MIKSMSQTLMTVVQELDKSLFEGYVKPKVTAVTEIMRKGVLDPEMDWYETPRPSGTFSSVYPCNLKKSLIHGFFRNQEVYVRNSDIPCGSPRTCISGVQEPLGTHLECSR